MNKKLIIFVLIIIAVLAFVYQQGYFRRPVQSPIQTPSTGTTEPVVGDKTPSSGITREPYVIEMTDIGFKPSTLEIYSGDTVKFVNRGNRSHWPASGTHPSHELCPGFDAFHSLVHNEEYSYTFNFKAPRICPFHDHVDPTLKGTVNIIK
ncbi:hypothetical protein A2833_03475 [Candidatus Azambacteria bacterium RIFCSPHIGHO2_01_FULL_44_55]|uniref:EfeO-type cupredoxin-like domain-containing protein n=1 Tax=Candidatus Azambacteria bacterium RIFCSPLOWO2_02_FULL_44_14 TaxID=1797306 RepID=A0A1F5CBX7_9BACT|nr:MAG: hypothetical protein A3A18_03080 [Candidatus Azambacteria bacterium RIFCSPLOWO2_01_FULL_44_84]OGD33675.1 MAG: hypothetical protein A3C78_01140 [Candidatus Azambacteria bacterium RIFCSPHIGHO2_02_FULL_45_18]OGD40367.1 MAG: hypothetical protein A3I30_03715 [Candidatus Azambacteria bacterium RIFCSPLOWO2_02_FULL_44_14]OGD40810.1 MAG: hypothetical protein A2833_03475 [Candidatus Azambacteria bacterium RIFCSPHIGHO2_01_FULL_44_55]OGD52214.1 MAG: hypothetical protein A2608_02145 [Candidatus Azam